MSAVHNCSQKGESKLLLINNLIDATSLLLIKVRRKIGKLQ